MFEVWQMWKFSDRTFKLLWFRKISVNVIWGDGKGTGPYEFE